MRRGLTGRFDVKHADTEPVRAFVPHPLPPDPPLALEGRLQRQLEAALVAIGRLDAVTHVLPDVDLFLYAYVRKEAVLSSQIEGTQSSLSDLLLFELKEAPGVPIDDVVEVSNYVAALEHGLERLRGGFPLSSRLIREIHAKLLARGRGADKEPGEFRRSQNWIGGTRPGNAAYVPPPHALVPGLMSDLERFLHRDDHLPILIKTAFAHVQFETIHPFLDGNGRIGRLLITFVLCNAGVLRQPLLYLSLWFKKHRKRYYELLQSVRTTGDWEAWVEFFLDGVAETASGAVATARRLGELFETDRKRLQKIGRASGSALRVHEELKTRPILTVTEIVRRTDLSFPAASAAMDTLVTKKIARELTGKKRGRVFAYGAYLAILGEGANPL